MRRILLASALAMAGVFATGTAFAQPVTGSFNGYTGSITGSSSTSITGITGSTTSATSGGNASNQSGAAANVAAGATGSGAYMGQAYSSVAGPDGTSVLPVNGFLTTTSGAMQNQQMQTFSVNTVGSVNPGTASGSGAITLGPVATTGSSSGNLSVSGCNGPACINPGLGGLNNQ